MSDQKHLPPTGRRKTVRCSRILIPEERPNDPTTPYNIIFRREEGIGERYQNENKERTTTS